MDINEIVLNEKALAVVDQGVWMEVDDAPGLELMVTGLQAEGARKLIRQKTASARLKARGKALTDEQLSNITKEVLVEEVLKDWRGLESEGKELPYSKELARKFIMSRGGERFTGMVLSAAQRLDDQANSYVEEVAKN